ncbi:putative quinol monooxygenase [Clostridium formicaceticum]|uniref:Monooxygenase n=1 Tax=Clostridium formicaceticum TaxID=1497 RepID=A0AAC9RLN7_9CLOT|nr:putative quinol monooxygenase [Clostridium formicaceticum]AOY74962.1 hypothetical protein BJL90_02700 [Clostridium formicaceticum]ARE89374.1 Putative monooxygenase [Clostridium formicaceticum]
MVSLIAKITALPGKEAQLVEAITHLTKITREEAGCITYIPHVSVENAAEIIIFEQYVDQAALDYHAESPHFKAVFAEKSDELLSKPIEVTMLKQF